MNCWVSAMLMKTAIVFSTKSGVLLLNLARALSRYLLEQHAGNFEFLPNYHFNRCWILVLFWFLLKTIVPSAKSGVFLLNRTRALSRCLLKKHAVNSEFLPNYHASRCWVRALFRFLLKQHSEKFKFLPHHRPGRYQVRALSQFLLK